MSSRGQIVIPQEVRERCKLEEGDHFIVEDNPSSQTVTIRRIKTPDSWFEVLKQCPASFEMARRRRFNRPSAWLKC